MKGGRRDRDRERDGDGGTRRKTTNQFYYCQLVICLPLCLLYIPFSQSPSSDSVHLFTHCANVRLYTHTHTHTYRRSSCVCVVRGFHISLMAYSSVTRDKIAVHCSLKHTQKHTHTYTHTRAGQGAVI